MIPFLIIYLILINLLTFFFMGADKRYAIHHAFRIPENFLLGMAFCGGGIGGLLGMKIFHHKTKKPKFKYGLPLAVIWNIILLLMIYYYI